MSESIPNSDYFGAKSTKMFMDFSRDYQFYLAGLKDSAPDIEELPLALRTAATARMIYLDWRYEIGVNEASERIVPEFYTMSCEYIQWLARIPLTHEMDKR